MKRKLFAGMTSATALTTSLLVVPVVAHAEPLRCHVQSYHGASADHYGPFFIVTATAAGPAMSVAQVSFTIYPTTPTHGPIRFVANWQAAPGNRAVMQMNVDPSLTRGVMAVAPNCAADLNYPASTGYNPGSGSGVTPPVHRPVSAR